MPSSTSSHAFEQSYPALPEKYHLQNYVIEHKLGKGAFGINYLAKEYMTDFLVVIKENFPEYCADRDISTGELRPKPGKQDDFQWALESFEKEARTLRKLPKHPNFVHIIGVFPALNTAYIVMERIEGENLFNLYPPGTKMEPELLKSILHKLLGALEQLHKSGIIHRDIKPANIMLTPEGEPVIIDFGAARPMEGNRLATQIGTPEYAPPEQLINTQYAENATQITPQPHWDLYALGRTCHQLITGYIPITGTRPLRERPELLNDYSLNLLESIDKAHEKAPADRWQSAQEWLAALNCAPQATVIAPPIYDTIAPLRPETNYEDIVAQARQLIDSKQYDGVPDMLRPVAESGYAAAQNSLGYCYYYGHGVQQDYTKAVEWYQKAAEQGYARAQNNLGNCYYYGHGVQQNYTQAVVWYQKAANQGDADAQNNLGFCYKNGHGVQQNYAKAVEWYQKAAEQGHAYAQNNLGICYQNGLGVQQNHTKAAKWYQKSAEQGNALAQSNLGDCYYFGHGVQQDYKQAVVWYQKAANQGTSYAQYSLGLCYDNGHGVTQDYTQAAEWYRKAAEQKHADAQYNLGLCYDNGHGVTQDYTQAAEWYQKAAEQGHAYAQNNLGICYQNGLGVQKNHTKAAKWYQKSAEQGNAYAQYNLGFCYEKGLGELKNYTKAVKWYQKAAEEEVADAQFRLGVCYENGFGVQQNYTKAAEWYRKAAEQGHADAQTELKKLNDQLSKAPKQAPRNLPGRLNSQPNYVTYVATTETSKTNSPAKRTQVQKKRLSFGECITNIGRIIRLTFWGIVGAILWAIGRAFVGIGIAVVIAYFSGAIVAAVMGLLNDNYTGIMALAHQKGMIWAISTPTLLAGAIGGAIWGAIEGAKIAVNHHKNK